MLISQFNSDDRKSQKALERQVDLQMRELDDARKRQERNRFIPNAKEWAITHAPAPMKGARLD